MAPSDAERARDAHRAGDMAAAADAYRRALAQSPTDWRLRHDHAAMLMQAGALAEAVAELQRIPEVHRGGEAMLMQALCLRGLGQADAGLPMAREAARLLPQDALAWMVLGSLEAGAQRYDQAEDSLRRSLALAPAFGEAWHYLGEVLQRRQRWREAIEAYRMAAREKPEEWFNIAMCAERAGDVELALDAYRSVAAAWPANVAVAVRLAQIQARLCLFDEEAATVSGIEARMARGEIVHAESVDAFPLTFLPLSPGNKRALLARRATAIATRAPALPAPLVEREGRHARPVRIGYISPDFGRHAVGHLVRDVFAAHDRARFEVFGYSLREHNDEDAGAIRAGCDRYLDCSAMSSSEVTHRIRADAIDVLVDLGGPTDGAREEILALRPAPVQLGWLGFIHAQAAPWLDAIMLDPTVQPASEPWPWPDRVLRLPGTLFPGAAMRPGIRNRSAFGLPAEGEVVLASFNNSYKLDAPLLQAWKRILAQAPRAMLLVYLPPMAREGFRRHWRDIGGDADRLVVVDALEAGPQADRLASCDLMLDAFRYQGGATTMDAIASGLPVLAVQGDAPPARMGASILRHLGLDELVARDAEEYVRIASGLANDPAALARLRASLPGLAARHRLFDPRRTAEGIEGICLSFTGRREDSP